MRTTSENGTKSLMIRLSLSKASMVNCVWLLIASIHILWWNSYTKNRNRKHKLNVTKML